MTAQYNPAMPAKPTKPAHPGRHGNAVSLAPLTMDQAVDAIFKIDPPDVKNIVGSRPGKKKGRAKK